MGKFMAIPNILVILLLLLSTTSTVFADEEEDSPTPSPTPTACPKSGFNSSLVSFNTSSLLCSSVWTTYDYQLMFQMDGATTWNFVLSAPNNDSYIAVGFSDTGKMVGSSAVVGWVPSDGKGIAKQYYLGGETPAKVLPDKGNLTLGKAQIILHSKRLYLAFQLNVTTPQPKNNLIYAIGQKNVYPKSDYLLAVHAAEISTTIDYTIGSKAMAPSPKTSGPSSTSPTSPNSDGPRNHGRLSMTAIAIIAILMAVALF